MRGPLIRIAPFLRQEHSLTAELLRKVSPREAELLRDPAIQGKVKFRWATVPCTLTGGDTCTLSLLPPSHPPTHTRFGGTTFPPYILFKVFTSVSGNGGVHYISGKKMIKPASDAAEDARRQMGNRRFYDQMLADACCHQQLKVTDEVDVTTMKEYMQYVANVDETPAYMGGKDNTWRRLNMEGRPHSLPCRLALRMHLSHNYTVTLIGEVDFLMDSVV